MLLTNHQTIPTVAIIGAGPAGLMAAEVLSHAGVKVEVFDAMPSVGRKLLMAGKTGLNLSHNEPFDLLLSRYGTRRDDLEPMLRKFTPDALRAWVKELGIDTFVGSSGRIFPTDMKAAPLLRAWLHRLRLAGVKFHVRHCWLGWNETGQLRFATPNGEQLITADAVLLALGGGSWPQLGSTGAWVSILQQQGIAIAPLKPSNCGFDVAWSDYFAERFAGEPLKSVQLSVAHIHQRGDCVVTKTGLEGGVIYSASALLRERCETEGCAWLQLDLMPDKSLAWLKKQLAQPRGKQSFSNHLRKKLGLYGVKAALLRELLTSEQFNDSDKLAETIKAAPIQLIKPRPLDEAISSAGGIKFEALDQNLMLRNLTGVFCAGEMLDWDAPTGGYLLTACFASGRAAADGILAWLNAFSKE